ncbi:apoptosis-inducing TAF9-like domain 1 family protein, putative [Cordyceps militaris CM01]|uniref:Apoptosis-inducing TAF9-like domain 1 family protein, putative n=1 Tax=Cordyceps militaris (strain CM01) TaxID=983644 RepID=G3J4S4_CORMM|nr:apoptosis-inducing TAF9-like domain 1 family protein, putative [Cordyceps militaris CM01]EGX96739.1 apoptosis-inducing TAF9-like domain 1 family protein, putative [Cordyceps militaris CM01]
MADTIEDDRDGLASSAGLTLQATTSWLTSVDYPKRLKSALWYAVGQIVDEECLRRNRNATPQFIGALTELVWTQIVQREIVCVLTSGWLVIAENVAVDLESFANHAGRSVVTTEDVLLLARKNPDLQQLMQEYIDEQKAARGRRPAAASASGGRGGRGARGGRGGARGGATRISER